MRGPARVLAGPQLLTAAQTHTHTHTHISLVRQVLNPELEMEYNAFRKTLERKRGAEGVNEMTSLFHGTSSTSPDVITLGADGIDPRMSGKWRRTVRETFKACHDRMRRRRNSIADVHAQTDRPTN